MCKATIRKCSFYSSFGNNRFIVSSLPRQFMLPVHFSPSAPLCYDNVWPSVTYTRGSRVNGSRSSKHALHHTKGRCLELAIPYFAILNLGFASNECAERVAPPLSMPPGIPVREFPGIEDPKIPGGNSREFLKLWGKLWGIYRSFVFFSNFYCWFWHFSV